MKLITLIENTPGGEDCVHEHGLSIYIETRKHNILLDTGATDAFCRNAKVLGLDLGQVDMLVLSHGHYDHGGGILEFVKSNPRARIYMRPQALKKYYHLQGEEAKYIGLAEEISGLSQIVFTGEQELLDEEVSLFSGVRGRRFWPQGNLQLKCQEADSFIQDTFEHEQSLVLREDGAYLLLSGCAHNGILNILDRFQELYGCLPKKVITGFHMKKKAPLSQEEREIVIRTAEELRRMSGTVFYSGHCTGEEAFRLMKEMMGEQLQALHSGLEIL